MKGTIVNQVAANARTATGRWLGLAATAAAALVLLAGCASTDLGIGSGSQLADNAGQLTPTPNANGEVVGAGKVRIGMLIPKSAPGNGAVVANEVRNGALLAMKDFGNADLELVIKDDAGQAAGAQAAASEAVREGSAAVLGPVFAATVSAASAITLPAGRTIVAFSTDTSNARRGVYLLSYTPQEDTRRIVEYALSRGTRSILAFLPSSAEGSVREATLRQVAGTSGASVQIIRYERSVPSIGEAVKSAAAIIPVADTIYIPEGGEIPNVIVQTIRRNSLDIVGKQIIGSGAWESVVFKEAQLEGALYPGRDLSRFADFSNRYQAAYGTKPNVWAALGYDSITLAVNQVRTAGAANAFKPQSLESANGFVGINGIFRLRSDGTTERGLAIYQVERNAGKLVVPAPATFGRGAS
jgi:ABC-type branched-subunit amino acid transport system substrate-binding protein